mmetsp:Transcript_7485/g.28080  ORF Transcript_7485/g.28080 Transcript_7485/m.28080 type:complete len:205 (+) Transcript_7485:979-1593(+)
MRITHQNCSRICTKSWSKPRRVVLSCTIFAPTRCSKRYSPICKSFRVPFALLHWNAHRVVQATQMLPSTHQHLAPVRPFSHPQATFSISTIFPNEQMLLCGKGWQHEGKSHVHTSNSRVCSPRVAHAPRRSTSRVRCRTFLSTSLPQNSTQLTICPPTKTTPIHPRMHSPLWPLQSHFPHGSIIESLYTTFATSFQYRTLWQQN